MINSGNVIIPSTFQNPEDMEASLCVTLRLQLEASQNKVFRKVLGPKAKEVTGQLIAMFHPPTTPFRDQSEQELNSLYNVLPT
jgi:hypothetical protein